MAKSHRRIEREREIVAATRALFDERGLRDAQIEDIAKAVGINRAIIYRHFSGKEELFAMTLVGYLNELDEALQAADDPTSDPTTRLRNVAECFLSFGEKYPAFVDCAHSLLRRRGDELLAEVSESVMFRLGRGMTACMTQLVEALEAGVKSGDFKVSDPYLLANVFYAQALGALNLARLQLSVSEGIPGYPMVSQIDFANVKTYMIEGAV
ncbi:MAG: TetR/AcrR family transcriptional regulator, partial [Aeromicrobium sp.]